MCKIPCEEVIKTMRDNAIIKDYRYSYYVEIAKRLRTGQAIIYETDIRSADGLVLLRMGRGIR